jgi:DnaJ-class molecular chaperone
MRMPDVHEEVDGSAMNLRITQEIKGERQQCPACNGSGKVPVPRTLATRTLANGFAADVPGEGHPMPCPTCAGKKYVLVSIGGDGS